MHGLPSQTGKIDFFILPLPAGAVNSAFIIS